MGLDRFDRLLLNAVQEDASRTSEQLSAEIPLSPSAIQRRLKRLREDGFIEREVAIVDPRKIGRPTFFIVSLEIERERPELVVDLRKWLSDHDEVQQVFYVTGNVDFILVLSARSTEEFDELMTRLVAENTNVRKFTTYVALGVPKRGLVVPIPLSDS